MHGLIFETSVWLLAESTRLLIFVLQSMGTFKLQSALDALYSNKNKQTRPSPFTQDGMLTTPATDAQIVSPAAVAWFSWMENSLKSTSNCRINDIIAESDKSFLFQLD